MSLRTASTELKSCRQGDMVIQKIRKAPTILRQWSHKLDISFGANRDAHIERHFCMSLRTAKVPNGDSVRSLMAD